MRYAEQTYIFKVFCTGQYPKILPMILSKKIRMHETRKNNRSTLKNDEKHTINFGSKTKRDQLILRVTTLVAKPA